MLYSLLLVIFFIFSCDLNDSGGEGSLPGDADWVPSGWQVPVLNYDKADYFASSVQSIRQAPGAYATHTTYGIAGNTVKLTGPPSGGGTYGPEHSSIVSLGMNGGYVVLQFDTPIKDNSSAETKGGYDFIVFGNAYWQSGDSSSPWDEPGTVWVMKDLNNNNIADDTWYLIPGPHLSASDSAADKTYDKADFDSAWWPEAESGDSVTFSSVFTLPDTLYTSNTICSGYADVTPTMILGDLDGDNALGSEEDYPGIDPAYFYTMPDTPGDGIIDTGSGGGDAIDIADAVNPFDWSPANLDEISWVKVVSGSSLTNVTGDYSTEVDAVARVRRQ